MAQDSTRRLLKVFGIAVTNLEDRSRPPSRGCEEGRGGVERADEGSDRARRAAVRAGGEALAPPFGCCRKTDRVVLNSKRSRPLTRHTARTDY